MRVRRRTRSLPAARTLLAGAVAVSAALTATACGSSSSDGAGGGTSSASTTASGGTISIMTLGSFSQPPYALGEIPVAAQAAVNAVNAAGGVHGRKLKLITCDDEMNPNDALACAREAVSDQVAAVVGTFTFYGDNIIPILQQAGIPDLLDVAIAPSELTSKDSFPVYSGANASGGIAAILGQHGCKKIADVSPDTAAARSNTTQNIAPVAEKFGATVQGFYVEPSATDMTPVISQVLSAGITCISFGTGPQQTAAGIIAARQSGKDVTIATTTLGLPQVLLPQLKSAGNGVYVLSPFAYPSSGNKTALAVQSGMAAVNPKEPVDDASLNAYAAVLAFAKVADTLQTVDAKTVLGALDSGVSVNTGLFAPTVLNDGGPITSSPRVSGSVLDVYEAENGKYVPVSTDAQVNLKTILGS